MTAPTYYQPSISSNEWYLSGQGRLTLPKRYDEKLVYDATAPLWDLADWLANSETISSVVFSGEAGLSVTATGNSNTAVYCTVLYTGCVEVTVTTSAGRIKQEEFWFEGTDYEETDY